LDVVAEFGLEVVELVLGCGGFGGEAVEFEAFDLSVKSVSLFGEVVGFGRSFWEEEATLVIGKLVEEERWWEVRGRR
jgi:hypothetical protein